MLVSLIQLNTRMSKANGGTRNYSGNYKDSYFDKSGGYYVVHKHHNEIADNRFLCTSLMQKEMKEVT